MKICEWCNDDGSCRVGNEADCDFRTLVKEPMAIKARMDKERALVRELIKQEILSKEHLDEIKLKMNDKLQGIRIMKEIYEDEFKLVYMPSDSMEFSKDFLSFIIRGKKFERGRK